MVVVGASVVVVVRRVVTVRSVVDVETGAGLVVVVTMGRDVVVGAGTSSSTKTVVRKSRER